MFFLSISSPVRARLVRVASRKSNMRFFWWRNKKRRQSLAQVEGDGSGVASHISVSDYQNHAANGFQGGPRVPSPDDVTDEKRSYGVLLTRRLPSPSASDRFAIVESSSRELALSNCLLVHSFDFLPGVHVMVNGRYPFTTKHDNTGTLIPGQISTSVSQRQWMNLSATDTEVTVSLLELRSADVYMTSLHLEIDFWIRGLDIAERFSADDMAKSFIKAFNGQIFGLDQQLVFDFQGQMLRVHVRDMNILELTTEGSHRRKNSGGAASGLGVLMEKTEVTFTKAPDSRIKIKSSAKKPPPNAILAPNFKFEDLGIGGLDKEFSIIFRRAFASRVFPPGLVDDLGIQHVKGILLFGPAGTGKTLLARKIGKMLRARDLKIVNGPEILNKFVGASEENVRKLFADAEKEYKEKGDESGLHIIIFDELDAICKQRGSNGVGGSSVGDTVVNQLLSKMDGVESLNNVLFIGMTNRLDMIDEALLRPGRFEVHLEISLPDEQGRLQILNIHTSKMKANGRLDADVDLPELAALTNNFSGAEISGLVKSAASFAFNRHVKVGTMAGISEDIETLRVNKEDFLHALDEVQPALGVSEEELQDLARSGIIHFDDNINMLLSDASLLVEQVRDSSGTPLVSILLHGPPGSGKTALAATIAQASQFPFIRLVSPDGMAGFTETQQVAAINKVFLDSYKSILSVIVIDDIERLLGWVPIGPRFSNAVLQVLLALLQRRPPKGRRLLVLATSSNRNMLAELQMSEVFHAELSVHPISTLRSLEYVLRSVDLFSNYEDRRRAMRHLDQAGFGRDKDGKPGVGKQIGIKKLLNIIAMTTREPEEVIKRLVEALADTDYDPTNSDGSVYGRTLAYS